MIKAKNIEWTMFETICSIMVVACLVGWKISGPWLATILSTAGVVFAGVPQIKDAYKAPAEMPLVVYTGYILVNTLSTLGGNSWTVEERLYPASCAVLCSTIVLVSCRKFISAQPQPRGT